MEQQDRITRAAGRLRLVTQTLMVLIALVGLAAIAVLAGLIGSDGPMRVTIDLGGLQPRAAGGVLIVCGLLLIAAFAELAAMLRAVERGVMFGAARRLRGFARYLFLAVLASVALPPLIQLASGAGSVSFDLSAGEAIMLLVTALLFFVGRLLDEAQRVADDHAQIV